MVSNRPLPNYCFLLLIISLFLTSCSRYKEIAYFQDIPTDDSTYKDGVFREKADFKSLKIQSGDVLQVSVQTMSPSSVSFGISSDESSASGGSAGGGTAASGYMVNKKGEIEMPLVGTIKVSGLTLFEIQKLISNRAEKFYKDPVVNVRLANFKITILGEVKSPGIYIMKQEKATILDALAQAGDMSIYGKRTNVLLAREVNGKEKMIRLDMNSSDVFNSPYFYLKQGDVIYVQPTRAKAAANAAPAYRMYATITSTLSLLLVILYRFPIK